MAGRGSRDRSEAARPLLGGDDVGGYGADAGHVAVEMLPTGGAAEEKRGAEGDANPTGAILKILTDYIQDGTGPDLTTCSARVRRFLRPLTQCLPTGLQVTDAQEKWLSGELDDSVESGLREDVWKAFVKAVFPHISPGASTEEYTINNLLTSPDQGGDKALRLKRLFEIVQKFSLPSELDDFFVRFDREKGLTTAILSQNDERESSNAFIREMEGIIAPSQPLIDSLKPPAIAKKVIEDLYYRGRPKSWIYKAYIEYFQKHPDAPGDAPNKRLGLRLAASVAYCSKKGKKKIGLESLNQTFAVILLRHCTDEKGAPKERLKRLIEEKMEEFVLPDEATLFPPEQVKKARKQGHRREKDHGTLDPIVSAFQNVLQLINDILDPPRALPGAGAAADADEHKEGDEHSQSGPTLTKREEFRKLLADLGLLYKNSTGNEGGETFDTLLSDEGKWDSIVADRQNFKQLVVTALLKSPVEDIVGRLNPSDYSGLKSEIGNTARRVQVLDLAIGVGTVFAAGTAVNDIWDRMHPPATYVPPAPTPYDKNCLQSLNITSNGDETYTIALNGERVTGDAEQEVAFPVEPGATATTQNAPAVFGPDSGWKPVPYTGNFSWKYFGLADPSGKVVATLAPGDQVTFTSPGIDGALTCPTPTPVTVPNAVGQASARMLTAEAGVAATAATAGVMVSSSLTLSAVAAGLAAAAGFTVLVYGAGRVVQWWRSGSQESSASAQSETAAPTTPFAHANKGNAVVHVDPQSSIEK